MDELNVPPTRYNLLRMARELTSLRKGRELLEEKREALMVELKRQLAGLQEAMVLSNSCLRDFLAALAAVEGVAYPQLSLSGRVRLDLDVQERSLMGVRLTPLSVRQRYTGKQVFPPGSESPEVEELVRQGARLVQALSKQGELQASSVSLAKEARKMQRRVNALEKIFIPQYERTVRFIASSLEEREREELISLKAVEEKLNP
ncbi:MAG: V-type ATP synthase subunit D [Thermoprotei archaeon]|nr:V-type ATP synthase subunit D [TACK group archaeon]